MKTLVVTSKGGAHRARVDAHVFGAWAAHRIPSFDEAFGCSWAGGWRVAHVCSAAAIAGLIDDLTEAEAIAIAKALSKQLPDFPNVSADDVRKGKPGEPWGYLVQAVVAETLEASQ